VGVLKTLKTYDPDREQGSLLQKKGFFAKDWFTNGGKLDKMCTSPDCALNTQAAAELKATNTS